MNRAEELIADLEAEIVKRDARIAELAEELALSNECLDMANENFATLKARKRGGVVLPPRMSAFADDFPERHTAARWFNSALDEVARLNPPGECVAALCTECGGTLKLAAN